MILITVAEIMTTRISTRSRKQAMDWSLVLLSQGIETVIDFENETGWGLVLNEAENERALAILAQYRAENRHWPWRRSFSSEGVLFDYGSFGWALLVCFFFWIQTRSGANFEEAGLMDAVAVSHGEWWRLFTAVFLHANLGHLAMNVSIGLALLGLTMGSYGTGIGLLAAYLTGAAGNVATWLVFSSGHRSLGASGMVMGCVGLLAVQSIFSGPRNPNRLKYALSSIAGGIMLFALLGLSPESDVLAHLGGFVSGVALGTLLAAAPSLRQNMGFNILAGSGFCLLVVIPWWLALGKATGG